LVPAVAPLILTVIAKTSSPTLAGDWMIVVLTAKDEDANAMQYMSASTKCLMK
jgi:hypothetical protein